MESIIKIVKSFENSGLLLKGVSETIQNKANQQKGGFPSMLLGTLRATLLENMLAGEGINRAGDGIIRAGYGSKESSKNKYFLFRPIIYVILKCKNIIRMNLELTEFILQIIYLIK